MWWNVRFLSWMCSRQIYSNCVMSTRTRISEDSPPWICAVKKGVQPGTSNVFIIKYLWSACSNPNKVFSCPNLFLFPVYIWRCDPPLKCLRDEKMVISHIFRTSNIFFFQVQACTAYSLFSKIKLMSAEFKRSLNLCSHWHLHVCKNTEATGVALSVITFCLFVVFCSSF